MYIELFGLPGSGKTTLCNGISQFNKLFTHIDDAFIYCLTDKYKLPGLITCGGGQNNWFRAYEKFYAKIGYQFDRCHRNYVRNIDNLMTDAGLTPEQKSSYLEYSIIDSKKYDTIKPRDCEKLTLHDEGFSLRSLIMFADLEPGHKYDTCYIKESPQPEVLVDIRTDIDRCVSRMQSRDRGLPKIYSGMNENEIRNKLEKLKSRKSDVMAEYQRQGTRGITIDNNKNKEGTIQELAVELENLCIN